MIVERCLTDNLKPTDYIPPDPSDIDDGQFVGDLGNIGVSLANRHLPAPSTDRGIPIVFTHIDGADRADRLDPSTSRAIRSKDRWISLPGLIAMRRGDDPHHLDIVAAVVRNWGWRQSGPEIVRFGIEKPLLYLDEGKGKMVLISGAHLVSQGIARFFPSPPE